MLLGDELHSSFFMLALLQNAMLDVYKQAEAWRNIHLYGIHFKFSLIRKYTG